MKSLRRFIIPLLLIAPIAVAQAAEPYTAAIVLDPVTGKTLYEKNPNEPRPIASMTKMMTLLVVLDQIEAGNISWDTPVEVSAKASRMGGSQVYLKHREVFPVEDLVAATMVHSANDAAMALAETVAGTERGFVRMMNEKAEELGLENTSFNSPHGLPAEGSDEEDVMSPRDLAIVGWELMKSDRMRRLAATQTMPFRDGEFTMYNPNHLIRDYPLATGIKTGYHDRAGFCVTASAKKGEMELVAVVMGSKNKRDNFGSAEELFQRAFSSYERIEPVQAGKSLPKTVRVLEGEEDTVPVVAARSVPMTVPRGERPDIDVVIESSSAAAPISKSQQVGWIIVRQEGKPVAKVPALAARPVERASWLARLWAKIWPFD
ncbi:MAG: D-alanyl-D-alanine carboxypeptidase family protein [Thermoanaerobaculia bacterium]|nr:D-alanyl-D-alanine carboxypeptidase family protein [Thermoanaerobaculia bacterium]